MGKSSYQAVENKARRQKHPVQTPECGEPREHCGPTPAHRHCQAHLLLSVRRSHQTGIQVHLELYEHTQIIKKKITRQVSQREMTLLLNCIYF